MNRITDAYDKWLAEMRKTTNIYEGSATYDACCEYYISVVERQNMKNKRF